MELFAKIRGDHPNVMPVFLRSREVEKVREVHFGKTLLEIAKGFTERDQLDYYEKLTLHLVRLHNRLVSRVTITDPQTGAVVPRAPDTLPARVGLP